MKYFDHAAAKLIAEFRRFVHITSMLIFLFTSLHITAQGLLFDDVLHEQQSKLPVYDDGSKSELEMLKGIYKVDLKPFCPEPQDQGFIASCTGWASGYGALTILNAIRNKWERKRDIITQNAFSALFIYNQIKKGSCDFGAYITDAAIFIRDKGDVLSKDYDKLKNKCDRDPTNQELEQALNFRIRDFISVFGPGDAGSFKIQRTKLSLAQKKPVVIGMSLMRNFQVIPKGYEYWYSTIGDTTNNGGHSMVVIGFDDGREAFEVMNSWGTNWGNDGFIWIKYRDFEKYVHYGYIFIPENETSGYFDKVASVDLRKPTYDETQTLSFFGENVQLKAGYYELSKGISSRGDLLQPVLLDTRKDIYFYLFSLDALNNIKVHWPRDALFDSRYEGSHESGFIALPNVNLPIPGRYSALRLSNTGNEYWCFLFSHQPIAKFNEYLALLRKNTNTDFNKKLKLVFGSKLLSGSRIKYAADRMHAESDMSNEGIVSMVLKLRIGG